MAEFGLALGVISVIQTASDTAERLYRFGKTVHDAKYELQDLMRKASSLRVVLQMISEALNGPKVQASLKSRPGIAENFDQLQEPLQICNESMIKFLNLLDENTDDTDSKTRRLINGVKWSYIKPKVLEVRNELAESRSNCEFALVALNLIVSIYPKTDDIDRKIQEAERDAVPKTDRDVSPFPPPYMSSADHQKQCANLLHAAKTGASDWVKALLNERAPVNYFEKDGRTALSFASEHGYIEVVRALVEHKANVNLPQEKVEKGPREERSQSKRTALHWAALGGHIEVVEALLAAGANKEARTYNGRSPVLEAAMHNQFQVVEYLLDRGVNVNAGTYYGWTMLHEACGTGNLELVELLLKHGANVEKVYSGYHWSRGTEGPTDQRPLHFAVKKQTIPADKKLQIVELLIEKGGAKVSSRDSYGATPIHAAVTRQWKDGLEVLLRRASRLDLDIMDKNRRTALDYAIEQSESELVDKIRAAQERQSSTLQSQKAEP